MADILGPVPADPRERVDHYASEIGMRLERFDVLAMNPINKRIEAVRERLGQFDAIMSQWVAGAPSDGARGSEDRPALTPSPLPEPDDSTPILTPPEPTPEEPDNRITPAPIGPPTFSTPSQGERGVIPPDLPIPPPGYIIVPCPRGETYRPAIPGLCDAGYIWDRKAGLCVCDPTGGGTPPPSACRHANACEPIPQGMSAWAGQCTESSYSGVGAQYNGFIFCPDGEPPDVNMICSSVFEYADTKWVGPMKTWQDAPPWWNHALTPWPKCTTAEVCCPDPRPPQDIETCGVAVKAYPVKGDDRVQYFAQVPYVPDCEPLEEPEAEMGEYDEDLEAVTCPSEGRELPCEA